MKHLAAHTLVALFIVLLSRESFKTIRICTSKRSKSVIRTGNDLSLLMSRHEVYRYEKLICYVFKCIFSVYIRIFLKDSRLSKTKKRVTNLCAAKCFIANINEFYGRLCSLFHTDTGKLKSFL